MGHRSRPNRSKALKAMRREEAQQRQEEHDARGAKRQLKLLDSRPGKAAKERKRLEKLVNS